MASPESIHSSSSIQTEHVLFRDICMYVYTYICVTTTNEERGHEFEREQGRVYEKV